MVQLPTLFAVVAVAAPSVLAAPLRGSAGLPQSVILEMPDGQPTVVTYEMEKPPMLSPSYSRFQADLPMGRVVDTEQAGGFPFVFGNSRSEGQSMTERLLNMIGLVAPTESSFAVSGPTRVIFAREDHHDKNHKDEHPKDPVGAWFRQLGDNIRKGWDHLVHPHHDDHKHDKGKHDKKQPTSTHPAASSASATPTATQTQAATAPTPTPAAAATATPTAGGAEPAAPVAGPSPTGVAAAEPTA